MLINIVAVDEGFLEGLVNEFGFADNVNIHYDDIFDVESDCIVAPTNSFGFMDGGFDSSLLEFFGADLQDALQAKIINDFEGELLVGQAVGLTGNEKFSHVIAAPTMRVPMILPNDTVNPFLACRAALREAKKLGVGSVSFTGLGTGVGKVSYDICIRQMRRAIDTFDEVVFPVDWFDAQKDHQMLYSNNVRDLQL